MLDHPKKSVQFQMPDLLAADLSHFWPTHSASALGNNTHTHTHTEHTHTHTHTHTHIHTHTHTHTHVPKAQENEQKHLQTCTASRHYHLYTTFAESCGYPRLRSCSYERARVRSGRAICADDFKVKSCALRLFHATDTSQTLAYVIHGAHPLLRRSCHFSVAAM